MEQQKFVTPLKVGLLIVVISYFLFTLHATFTLEWLGEWDRIAGGAFRTAILVEDVTAFVCLFFRFAASIVALAAVMYYFVKKSISKPATYKILRVVLIFEAIYWLGLAATTFFTVEGFARALSSRPIASVLDSLVIGVIPSVVEAIILPITLFILAFKLSPNKPLKGAIKWSLITGALYMLSFWLVYTSIWVGVIRQKGMEYLTARPENIISFALTSVGLVALAIYTAYSSKKLSRAATLQDLKLGTVGVIILALGTYFLWNYLSWVILAGNQWNDWYAMFLGHNLNLWMLSLPLVGLPLLFHTRKPTEYLTQKQQLVNTQKQSIFFFFYLIRVSSSIGLLRAFLKFALNSPKALANCGILNVKPNNTENYRVKWEIAWLYALGFYPTQTLKIHHTLIKQLRELFAKFFPRNISRYKT